MTRPGLFIYLFGNRVVSLGSLGLLGYLVYRAYLGEVSYVAVVLAAVAAARCWHCASQVQAYARWQREWEAMTGKRRKAFLAHMSPAARGVVIIGIWLGGAAFSIATMPPEYRVLATDWFWLINGLIALYLAGKFVLAMLGRISHRAPKPFDVRVCVSKPSRSPDYRQTYAQLPDYCQRILTVKE